MKYQLIFNNKGFSTAQYYFNNVVNYFVSDDHFEEVILNMSGLYQLNNELNIVMMGNSNISTQALIGYYKRHRKSHCQYTVEYISQFNDINKNNS